MNLPGREGCLDRELLFRNCFPVAAAAAHVEIWPILAKGDGGRQGAAGTGVAVFVSRDGTMN